MRVAAFRDKRAGLVISRLPQTKPSITAKSEEAMRERISALGGTLAAVRVVPLPADGDNVLQRRVCSAGEVKRAGMGAEGPP